MPRQKGPQWDKKPQVHDILILSLPIIKFSKQKYRVDNNQMFFLGKSDE